MAPTERAKKVPGTLFCDRTAAGTFTTVRGLFGGGVDHNLFDQIQALGQESGPGLEESPDIRLGRCRRQNPGPVGANCGHGPSVDGANKYFVGL